MHVNPRIAQLLQQLVSPALPGIDLSLTRMEQLLAALGNPERHLPPVIHLAGTNGKGSTLAFLRAMYQAAGKQVHCYTSPHLVRFNERIQLAGQEIEDDVLLPILAQVAVAAATIPVTFFEATTAAAFLAFSQTAADIVLLETGLGGRLDATNVVPQPLATLITPIDYDHMEFLGDTITSIATEKAGIMKPGVPCFVGEQPLEALTTINQAAVSRNAPLQLHGRDWQYRRADEGLQLMIGQQEFMLPKPALLGAHQYHNAALAATVAAYRQLPAQAIGAGVASAHWPARLQRLQHGPLVERWGSRGMVILDGAHNQSAAQVLREWMEAQGAPVTLIAGMMRRKDAVGFFRILQPAIQTLLTVPIDGEECYTPDELADAAREVGIPSIIPCASLEAAGAALAGAAAGSLIITGSLFLAGEILKNHG